MIKRSTLITILFCMLIGATIAQEKYGKTLNIGVGIGGYAGYNNYVGRSIPVIGFNYEFDILQNITLAPFISASAYSNQYYWGNKNTPYRYYSYRETIIPIGIKGTYYFDELLKASSSWDFYGSGSLGMVLFSSRWEDGYGGDKNYYSSGRASFIDIHLGAEYHVTSRFGVYLDLSTGVSTIGLAIH